MSTLRVRRLCPAVLVVCVGGLSAFACADEAVTIAAEPVGVESTPDGGRIGL